MSCNVKIFVDFWNFQLAWNRYYPKQDNNGNDTKIGWRDLPTILLAEIPQALGSTAQPCTYKGVQVYASVNPDENGKDAGLKKFLASTLGQMTGYTVNTKLRKARKDTVSGQEITKYIEKGVDTQIVTDLFAGAINDSYDVALLVSNDSDYVPAIEVIQDRLNKQIIHVGFKSGGDAIRTACWSHITLDGDLAEKIKL
ncbi:NYN domain-containing protein [Shinella zoogloeoides]